MKHALKFCGLMHSKSENCWSNDVMSWEPGDFKMGLPQEYVSSVNKSLRMAIDKLLTFENVLARVLYSRE